MFKFFAIILPVMTMIIAIQFKVPEKGKDILFKAPLWLIGTTLSYLVIPHIVTGVLAGPAILLADLLLIPSLWVIKDLHNFRKENPKASFKTYLGHKSKRKAQKVAKKRATEAVASALINTYDKIRGSQESLATAK